MYASLLLCVADVHIGSAVNCQDKISHVLVLLCLVLFKHMKAVGNLMSEGLMTLYVSLHSVNPKAKFTQPTLEDVNFILMTPRKG